MKISIVIITSALTTLGCAEQPSYQLATSSQQLKEIQILDPQAPERNDGIAVSLDGNYGKKVINGYLGSSYETKAGRDVTEQSSGKGKGK